MSIHQSILLSCDSIKLKFYRQRILKYAYIQKSQRNIKCHFQHVILIIVLLVMVKHDGGQSGTRLLIMMNMHLNLENTWCVSHIYHQSLIVMKFRQVPFLFVNLLVICQCLLRLNSDQTLFVQQIILQDLYEISMFFMPIYIYIYIKPPTLLCILKSYNDNILLGMVNTIVFSPLSLIGQVGFQFKKKF